MDDSQLRFPVGRFSRPETVNPVEREQYIHVLAGLPRDMADLTRDLSDEQLSRTYRDGGWTVRQVVHHVADSHINAYVRFRLALTEDVPVIKPYAEELWAELPDASSQPVGVSLQLLDALHRRWVVLLQSMNDEQFAREYRHPELGDMRLDVVLALYSWHSRHHLGHLRLATGQTR